MTRSSFSLSSLLVLTAAAAVSGCDATPQPETAVSTADDSSLPLEISVGQTKALLDSNPETVLIDCRELDEYERVSIASAVLAPLSDFENSLKPLGDLGDKPVVVHCHAGSRSMRAAQWLRRNGVTQAQSMAGGIDQWAVEVEPGMERY